MLHITNEESFLGAEPVIPEDAVDGVPLVGNAGVGLAEEVVHAEAAGLVFKIGLVDGAEEEDGQILGVAVFEDFAGAGEKGDGVVEFPEDLAEDFLQFMKGSMGDVFFVKAFVREIELFPEGLAIEGGFAVGGKDPIGGLEYGGEIIHEGAGPVEDKISNHRRWGCVNVNVSRERNVPNRKV